MSIQAHKCNQPNCEGFILFDNADFDYKDAVLNNRYVLVEAQCTECEHKFKVVVAHALIEVEGDEYIDELPQVCYTEFEKRKRQLQLLEVSP